MKLKTEMNNKTSLVNIPFFFCYSCTRQCRVEPLKYLDETERQRMPDAH